MADFKIRKVNSDYKVIDRKSIVKNSLVHSTFKTKDSINKATNEEESNNPNDYATKRIIEKGKETTYQSGRIAKNIVINKYKKRKLKNKNIPKIQTCSNVKTVSTNNTNNSSVFKISNSNKRFKNSNTSSNKTGLIKRTRNNVTSHMIKAKRNYEKQKQIAIAVKRSAKRAKKAAKETVIYTYKITKELVKALSRTPFVGWIFGLLFGLLLIVLFSAALTFMNNNTVITGYSSSSVSAEVKAYEPLIINYANKYGIPDYVPLIEAVMMQESGGLGTDPMQSSECGFNTRYPHKPNAIQEPEYSIDCGVQSLADCLSKAKVNNTADMQNIYLALQGYNYGSAYITWAVKNYSGYSEANAKAYSEMMKQKHNTKVYGDPEYVSHVMRYYDIGNGDIVNVAKKEVGNKGGEKYWRWYGFDHKVEWCACFVSWCGNQAGLVQNGSMPKFASCKGEGVPWFIENKRWADRNAIPMPGYIIFFDWDNDGSANHVGIVERIEGNTIYTIEGNSSNECKERKYDIGYRKIYGYGVIK